MSIYVIFTGGTIGSSNTDNVISTDSFVQEYFISKYKEKFISEDCFKCVYPYSILSENLDAEHLLLLINTVKDVLKNDDVQGIIINHGTDTLQYTSAVLSYIFSCCDTPILLVSSNYVLSDPRANGLINFHCAVRFINEFHKSGVYVSYKNDNDIPYIHMGARLNAPLLFSADISSVKDTWFAKYANDMFVLNDIYNDMSNKISLFTSFDDISLFTLAQNIIMWIKPYPGMSYVKPTENTKAVLHESFHSGTIAINDELKCFANECKRMNIPMYITGLEENEAVYDNVIEYIKLGFIPLYGCSPIAIYCKLWLSLCNNLEVSENIKKCVAFDMI